MTKKKGLGKPRKPVKKQPAITVPTPPPSPEAEVRRLRTRLEAIDKQLVELVNSRAALAVSLGQIKTSEGVAAHDVACEQEVFAKIAEMNGGPVSPTALQAVFREIISGSRALETKLRVTYLGPAYSYSHLAAIHRYGQSAELVPVGSITAVFEEVETRQANVGIVPLENSTDGRIADTLDNFARKATVRICGEVQLRIHHHLLGRCPRGDVQEVYSRPQALSQCRNWLSRHMPTARLVEVTSTSTAAQLARDKAGAAAIASHQAGVNYGLEVLASNIEDNPSNVTRFAVLGLTAAPRTGDDKTALMFELAHRPGSLADALTVFKRQRVNLTWLESFPMAGQGNQSGPQGGYLFFTELEGHPQDLRVRRALELLAKKVVKLTVLGSYARSAPAE